MGSDINIKAGLTLALVFGGLLFYRMLHPATVLAADGMDPNWDFVAETSETSGEPTVVLFTADWCGSCQWLHQNVLARADVQSELRSHYNFCKVDLTAPTERVQSHAAKLGVHGIPCMIRYDVDGKETDRVNALSPEAMIAWLKAGESKD